MRRDRLHVEHAQQMLRSVDEAHRIMGVVHLMEDRRERQARHDWWARAITYSLVGLVVLAAVASTAWMVQSRPAPAPTSTTVLR
jgi:hypothetical protein